MAKVDLHVANLGYEFIGFGNRGTEQPSLAGAVRTTGHQMAVQLISNLHSLFVLIAKSHESREMRKKKHNVGHQKKKKKKKAQPRRRDLQVLNQERMWRRQGLVPLVLDEDKRCSHRNSVCQDKQAFLHAGHSEKSKSIYTLSFYTFTKNKSVYTCFTKQNKTNKSKA